MPTAPKEVLELVEQFERNINSYRNPAYNEAQVRQEFINPLFEALGWDMANRQGYAEAYKEVIHEAAVKVGAATKAPDYAFRIGGTKKFFLEAKKPGVDIKNNSEPAYQLRRYAWSAGLPLSILTDFEEFAVYDCRIRPQKSDKASVGRTLYLTYREYETRWAEIANVFAKESILQGSFDRYAEGAKGKRGTSPVDDAFLKEIEEWRSELAHDLARRNSRLKVRDLNFAVQRTIDRIIFLRMCEDRGIESYGQLQALLNGKNVYARLRQIFTYADEKYNSGLFHFEPEAGRAEAPDELTPKLKIDDKVLKHIIGRLYYPESPYEFSVLSGDILGNVYEQFLGKVIHLTKTHQARIEEKPEVKKAGGVYYTPKYIVNYIVKNTVGKLCEAKTPKQIEKLKTLDPACGSGSFLIGAYSYLLDYHRDWYEKNGPEKHTKEIYQGAGGQWYLNTQKKKEILLNNIYGVDIDSQAVEVTKLNLLLKVLEGETKDTLESQMKLWRHRALPDLGNNIKCGNSLIGPDYYHGKQQTLFDEEEKIKVNAFDWKTEFSEIMKQGGFDAVIGNPPYVRPHNLPGKDKQYFWAHYETFVKKSDLYCCFMQKAIGLVKTDGLFSFIVSEGWLRLDSFEELRKYILLNCSIMELVDLPDKVFQRATVKTTVFIFRKTLDFKKRSSNIISIKECDEISHQFRDIRKIPQQLFMESYKKIFDTSLEPATIIIKQKMKKGSVPLGELVDIRFGLKTGDDDLFIHSKRKTQQHKPLLRGGDVFRYGVDFKGEYVWYSPERMRKHRKTARPGEAARFEQPKILIKDTSSRLGGTLDLDNFYVKDALILTAKVGFPNLLHFLTAILNSSAMRFYYETSFPTLHVQNDELSVLPILAINLKEDQKGKLYHDQIVELVKQILELNKELQKAKTPDDKTRLQRQIDATDRQIDQLVYELYGLTEEEIAVVEGK